MLGQFNKTEMDRLIGDAIARYRDLSGMAAVSRASDLMDSASKNINQAELERCRTFCPVERKNGRFKILWGGDGRYHDPLTPEQGLLAVRSSIALANSQLTAVESMRVKPSIFSFGVQQPMYIAKPSGTVSSSSDEDLLTLRDRSGITEQVAGDVSEPSPKPSNVSSILSFLFNPTQSTPVEETTVNPEVERIKNLISRGVLGGSLKEELAAEGINLQEELQAKPVAQQVDTLLSATPLRNNSVLLTSLDQAQKLAGMIFGPLASAKKDALAEQLFAESKRGKYVYLPPIAAQVVERHTFNWPIFLFGVLIFTGVSYFTYKVGRKKRKKPGVVRVDAEIIRPALRALPAPR